MYRDDIEAGLQGSCCRIGECADHKMDFALSEFTRSGLPFAEFNGAGSHSRPRALIIIQWLSTFPRTPRTRLAACMRQLDRRG